MDKFLYPTHLFRCSLTGPSECGKSYFRTTLILNINNEFEKKIHLLTKSPSRLI